ncbi:MAG: 2-oxo acid dehydrogenase subunit E2 [Bacteroidetes bacterium]|nr:2-oxo acid dehydrogenase subunit E2 [Bacteroidota bacterium]MCB0802965.1 2-oxo acid dehydrogenase subunit E2 [Flavobacteriales bacterium]NOG58487.1 2-oxo acid dehydrogenase subunit E2 [Bacteroidota bacterium]
MAAIEVKLPKMGESISEATALNWLKNVGDFVEAGESILEVATDKVDSEIAAPESGIIKEIKFEINEIIEIGSVIAIIETERAAVEKDTSEPVKEKLEAVSITLESNKPIQRFDENGKFYSPLVRNIAEKEGVSFEELQQVEGTGSNGRVLKVDLENYLKNRTNQSSSTVVKTQSGNYQGKHEIIEMDRMRSMIADHMVHSKHTSPHVTSYVEADVTELVKWRETNKDAFAKKHGQKITFTPIFVEAVVEALKEYPLINVSVEGNKIIVKKDMHIGLATALPNGNLIVPVIRNADQKNLLGLTKDVNDLVGKARTNKLKPDEIQGSTFTISNVGTFRNIMGTPIINQPEVAILATGAIRKRAAVVETEYGDVIAIRHMMYLSLSYDHRVVDGNLGGSFLARIGDHLEAFDKNRVF